MHYVLLQVLASAFHTNEKWCKWRSLVRVKRCVEISSVTNMVNYMA